MGGGDQVAPGGFFRHPEGDHRGPAPADVVFPAGGDFPLGVLLQRGVALRLQNFHQICLGVIGAVGVIQIFTERLNAMVHMFISFQYVNRCLVEWHHASFTAQPL